MRACDRGTPKARRRLFVSPSVLSEIPSPVGHDCEDVSGGCLRYKDRGAKRSYRYLIESRILRRLLKKFQGWGSWTRRKTQIMHVMKTGM